MPHPHSACLAFALAAQAASILLGQNVAVHTLVSSVGNPVALSPGRPNALGHPTLLVTDRMGAVRLVDTTTGVVAPTVVVTPSGPVNTNGDNGTQCAAFGPDAFTGPGGHVYIYYNTSATTAVLERWTLNADHTQALPGTAQTILRYQRAAGHNGGWLGFSPTNGFLYLSLGDGGFADNPDPTNASQSLEVLQGKVIRLDPTGDDFPADPDRNFRIPPTNPFIGQTSHGEIWDYGLRNPWRCCFDPLNGDFWIADVGQDTYEEIDVERTGAPSGAGGHNYGWKCYEGPQFTGYSPCTASLPFTPPLYTYTHADGCSITGGVVYRGSRIPSLYGAYLFSDFCVPAIWSLKMPGDTPTRTTLFPAGGTTPQGHQPANIASFGVDSAGEPYFADVVTGRIFSIRPASCPADLGGPGGLSQPDGLLNNNDFIAFINAFFAADPRADVGSSGGHTGSDGAYDNNDFIAFINLFFAGC
ncbi:MAG: PQQ-dependent sugar dehydrogenase [Phycisphaerales bacterium]